MTVKRTDKTAGTGRAEKKMVIGVSSRALFDLTVENEIFEGA